jgi:hypothetical protein
MLHLWTPTVSWKFSGVVCVQLTGSGMLASHSSKPMSMKKLRHNPSQFNWPGKKLDSDVMDPESE